LRERFVPFSSYSWPSLMNHGQPHFFFFVGCFFSFSAIIRLSSIFFFFPFSHWFRRRRSDRLSEGVHFDRSFLVSDPVILTLPPFFFFNFPFFKRWVYPDPNCNLKYCPFYANRLFFGQISRGAGLRLLVLPHFGVGWLLSRRARIPSATTRLVPFSIP